MLTYLEDTNAYESWNGSAFVALVEAPDLTTLIPKSTVTTAEDLIVGDGASSVTRLGVGTDDQVLSVVAGAVAWADAGGGGGLEVIASGSLPAGALSITSIPTTYKNLQLVLSNFSLTGTILYIRVNNDTSNNTSYRLQGLSGAASVEDGGSYVQMTNSTIGTDKTSTAIFEIYDYSQTSGTAPIIGVTSGETSSAKYTDFVQAGYKRAAAITRLDTPFTVFDAGTYVLYGVN
jgi:hypothetical protein